MINILLITGNSPTFILQQIHFSYKVKIFSKNHRTAYKLCNTIWMFSIRKAMTPNDNI